MEPAFFGEPALFGAYHPPPDTAGERPSGVLLCPPVAHEHTRASRAVKGLADSLARAGHHVLRFDYRGVGDSAGAFETATVASWCDDIGCALQELGELSGARDIHVVGLRLGAALAAATLGAGPVRRGRLRVRGLVLWDPVLSGGAFLETAERLSSLFVRDPWRFPWIARLRGGSVAADPDERLGYAYPETLRSSLLALDMQDPSRWPEVPTSFVLSEPVPAIEKLAGALLRAGGSVRCVQVPNADGSWSDYHQHEKTLRAGQIVHAIVELLGTERP